MSVRRVAVSPAADVTTPQRTASRATRYTRNLLSSYGVFAGNILLYALATPWILHRLGASSFGIWLILLQVANTVTLATAWIAAPVLYEAAARFGKQDADGLRRLVSTSSLYYGAVGGSVLVVLVVASVLRPVQQVSGLSPAALMLALSCIGCYVFFSLQNQVLFATLSGCQRADAANWFALLLTTLATGLSVAAVWRGMGVPGIAASYAVSVAFVFMTAVGYFRLRFGFTPPLGGRFDRPLLLRLLKSGGSYFVYSASYLALQSDVLLVGALLGPSSAAIYGVAYKVVDYAVQIIWRIPDSFIPIVAELHAAGDTVRLRRAHHVAMKSAVAAALLAGVLFSRYGYTGVELWLGRAYTPSAPVFVAFAALVLTQVFVHSSIVVPYGAAQMGGVAIVAAVEATIKVLLSVVLLAEIGLIGVVLATIVSQVLATSWFALHVACRITGERPLALVARVTGSLPVPAAAALLTAWLLSSPESWLEIAYSTLTVFLLFALSYAALSLSSEERAELRRVITPWSA